MQKHLLTALAALCFAFASAQPTSGLVAYWPMNGNFNDAGPNAINGTNIGATATTDKNGTVNAAMAFANPTATAAQYATHPVNAALNFSGTQNFSISFAFYINSPWVHNMGLYDNCLNYAGPGIYIWQPGAAPNIQFNYKNGSLASTLLSAGTWYYITCLRNNGTLQIYINGVLNASGPEGAQVPVYAYPARFGTMFFNGTTPPQYNPLHGKLDEMRIYNRALSAAEVTSVYNAWAAIALPVKMTSFTAAVHNSDALLNWQTEYEINSSHYNVQRSTDGFTFTSIGTVQAAGNTTIATDYQYTDNTLKTMAVAANKTVYYRLQQVDKNGRSEMSSIVAVKYVPAVTLFTLLQNPAVNDVRLQVSLKQKEKVQLFIGDAMGRAVITRQIVMSAGQTFTALPVHLLAAGTYYITVTAGTEKQTLAFMKE